MSQEKRVEKLETQVPDVIDDVDHMVYVGGEPMRMTPEEWRAYRRKHPEKDFITIREYPSDTDEDSG